MATPRKHWFRVADALVAKPMTNDELAFGMRLFGLLNSRWARDGLGPDEAITTVVSGAHLADLAGCSSPVKGLRIARAFAVHVDCIIEERGAHYSITVPKWAEFQQLVSRPGAISGPRVAPSASSPARRKTPPKKESRARRAPVSLEGHRLAELLKAELLEHVPRAKPPESVATWAEEIDRMIRLDKIPAGEIERVIRWVTRDEFWATNVMSASKLRKQYARLLAKMNHEGRGSAESEWLPQYGWQEKT